MGRQCYLMHYTDWPLYLRNNCQSASYIVKTHSGYIQTINLYTTLPSLQYPEQSQGKGSLPSTSPTDYPYLV